MYKQVKFSLLSLVFFLLGVQAVLATEIKTSIDRNPVSINESFQLVFSATESPDDDPDFSPLEKNFQILEQRQERNLSWGSAQSTNSHKWILNLMAKQTGNQLIPPVSFGQDVSQSVTILVTKNATPGNSDKKDDLFLEVQVSSETPYVQAQVLYTLRLYSSEKVQFASQPRLSELQLPGALIEKLGDVKTYETNLNGIKYTVNEINYAIFPQKSGATTIPPMLLTAEVSSGKRSRSNSLFYRKMTKTKRVSSRAITLDIQSAPDDFKGKRWLPAELVYIEEKWSGDIAAMKLGEPLTRTLTVFAKGTTVAQLPELHNSVEIAQLKTYPDQPTLKEQKRADGVLALREEKIAYIPSNSGSFTLPAIEVSWFNVNTQKMEIARIAEKTVSAIAAPQSQIQNDFSVPGSQTNTVSSEPVIVQVENKFWMWLALFLAMGWLLTTFFFIRKLKPKPDTKPVNPKAIKLKVTVKALKLACAENNPVRAKEALLSWGQVKFNSNSLSAIATHCEARLRDEINLLNQTLYADKTEPWQGKKLFQFFTENNAREKVAKKIDNSLEPLYKS